MKQQTCWTSLPDDDTTMFQRESPIARHEERDARCSLYGAGVYLSNHRNIDKLLINRRFHPFLPVIFVKHDFNLVFTGRQMASRMLQCSILNLLAELKNRLKISIFLWRKKLCISLIFSNFVVSNYKVIYFTLCTTCMQIS